MPKRRVNLSDSYEDNTAACPPPLTPEAKEQQMISLAMDLVEARLRNGTASSQETTHFLKLATAKYQLELEQTRQQTELMKAKQGSLESNQRMEELYKEAIDAMKVYSGASGHVEYVEEDDE